MNSKNSNRLTNAEKKEIITYLEQNKATKFTSVAQLFSEKLNKQISAKSIGNYSKNKESIIANAALNFDIKRITKGSRYQELNDKLWDWIQTIESFGAVYSEKILKEKALQIAKEMNIDEFRATNGWLYSFKSAHNINCKILSGEASNYTKQNFTEFYELTNKKMSEYAPENIYNCDETALFFKQVPSRSLMAKARKGIKAYKDRVSLLLCTNLTGSDKRKLFIIGKSRCPRALKHFNYESICDYASNKTAWMTSDYFNNWLMRFDRDLCRKSKKILLLLDNCPAHNIKFVPGCIELIFLPKNSTFITQPLDAGIIKSFKGNYFHYLISNVLSQLNPDLHASMAFKKHNIKEAIIFSSWAWDNVSSETIINCWKEAGYNVVPNCTSTSQVNNDFDNLQEKIDLLGLSDPVGYEKFISGIATENELIQNIVEDLQDENTVVNENSVQEITDENLLSEEEIDENIKITLNEAKESFKIFKEYILMNADSGTDLILNLGKYEKFLNTKNKTKKKITDFFSK